MKVQKLIGQLFQGLGSTTSGIDIEFIDESMVEENIVN